MRRLLVEAIKGEEILARPVYSDKDIILIAEGTVLKKEYVRRLVDMGVHYVYVEDTIAEGVMYQDIVHEVTRTSCKNEMKVVIEKYSTNGKADFEEIINVAEDIIDDIFNQTEVLINMVDIRQNDEYAYSHSVNVCALAVFIALKMGLPKKKVKEIAIGSLLHDIGTSLLPEMYLKDHRELTEKEIQEYKRHVIYGYEAVKDEKWLTTTSKNIILSHHERENGSGYPFGWTGDKLKVSSKIVIVCDAFDSMVYGRHSKTYKIYEAIEYLVSQSGILFDEQIVKVFIDNIALYPSGTGVITNDGDIGIVLRQNNGFPARPVIRLIKDKDNHYYDDKTEIDLTEILTVFIVDTIELE